jgi:ABC-type polysaccharide/polyol phosphate transport system ATPase subunit
MHSEAASARTSEYAIDLEGVSKRYFLDPQRPWKLKDLATKPMALLGQLRAKEPFWALRDISIKVRHGEILGVIGPNGSGKSSLLRILAGISPPTTGTVAIDGRYGALLDLGAGFHPNATGRQNAYVNALFMGLSKSEAKEKMQSIIDFAELGQFIDQPMRTYSSGMYLRLGFSVAIHVRPDILIVDEVLAVGDANFQEKCFNHFRTLKERGTTIVIVTHIVETLMDFADRVIMLEKGHIKLDGPPVEVVSAYLNHLRETSPSMERAYQRAMLGWRAERALRDKTLTEGELVPLSEKPAAQAARGVEKTPPV